MKTPLKRKKRFENNMWVVGRLGESFFMGRTCKVDDFEMVSIIQEDGGSKIVSFDLITEIKKISFKDKMTRPEITSTLFAKKKPSATEKLIIDVLREINKH